MPEYAISREDNAPESQHKLLEARLNEHDQPFEGADQQPEPIQLYVRDSEGAIVAGLAGGLYRRYIYVNTLWVHEELRSQGYGARLMQVSEDAAREHGCTESHLSTLSYQARPFYERLGYAVIGSRPYGNDHERFFMCKKL